MVPELPLTLPDPVPGPPAHVDHVVSVEAAQLLLTLRQSLDPENGTISNENQGALTSESLLITITLIWFGSI